MVGLDLGFGYTKVAVKGQSARLIKVPSVFKKLRDGYTEISEFVEYAGERWVVGERAMEYPGVSPTLLSVQDLIRYAPVFLLYLTQHKGLNGIKKVATGLPPEFLRPYAQELKERIASTLGISSDDVGVFPQGVGILIDVFNKVSSLSRVLVVDIGFNTLDIVYATRRSGGSFKVDFSRTYSESGILFLAQKLRDALGREVPIIKNMGAQEMLRVVEEGKLNISGRVYDLTDYVINLKQEYVEEVKWKLQELKDVLIVSEALVLGGGGAYYIKPQDFADVHSHVILPQDPEYAQARGYYKLLEMLNE